MDGQIVYTSAFQLVLKPITTFPCKAHAFVAELFHFPNGDARIWKRNLTSSNFKMWGVGLCNLIPARKMCDWGRELKVGWATP